MTFRDLYYKYIMGKALLLLGSKAFVIQRHYRTEINFLQMSSNIEFAQREPLRSRVYLTDTYLFELDELRVIKVEPSSNPKYKEMVFLDRTIAHPQGGGQPCDTGSLFDCSKGTELFKIQFVQSTEAGVAHFGESTNEQSNISPNSLVRLGIDRERRILNARLHSAGHLLDAAMSRLGAPWSLLLPLKGYHFPDGPNVEFAIPAEVMSSVAEEDVSALAGHLEESVRNLQGEDEETTITYTEKEGVGDDLVRVVRLAGSDCPCGGTHVLRPSEIGVMTITKVKRKKDNLKISYTCT